MDPDVIDDIENYLKGRGCIIRYGYIIYKWGNIKKSADVASAAKTLYTHFLFKALEDKKITSLDERVSLWEPRLNFLNEQYNFKDREITWRHLANQTACYGVVEKPGHAYIYNDCQMALFWDTLFLKVYGVKYNTVDDEVLKPFLTDLINCQDDPTFIAFGVNDRPGRLSISPRDFARFGLLYLNLDNWKGQQLINSNNVYTILNSPIPSNLPRAGFKVAKMIQNQRSIGSKNIPDNQNDHCGNYSWLWWINGVDINENQNWIDAPKDTFAAIGHDGREGLAIIPSLNIVISWNDSRIQEIPKGTYHLNEVFKLLVRSCNSELQQ